MASASNLEIDIGQAGKRALVFSGIAIPSWNLNDDSNIYRQTITVNLRYTVLAVEQATISMGLASIYNDDSPLLVPNPTTPWSVATREVSSSCRARARDILLAARAL